MSPKTLVVALLLFIGIGVSLADDPTVSPAPATQAAPEAPQIPRTHVDSTVVGDSAADANESRDPHNAPTNLSNDRGFRAGAPELLQATAPLNLSTQQKGKLRAAIEQSDAGAAVLIKRENVVREMLASTTPEDPLYAKLQAEQGTADARWKENRDDLQRAVRDLLTPAQRAKFAP